MLRVRERYRCYALVSVTRRDIDVGVGERYTCYALEYTCYSLVRREVDETLS